MDPLSITTGCVSLTAGISNLVMRISMFVAEVRSARKDMDAVLRELASLQLSLGTLGSDSQHRGIAYPPGMEDSICQILVNVEMVTNQKNDLLIKLSSGRLGRRVQWAMTEKDEVNKLRSSLESNKMALEVALTVGTISILSRQNKSMIKQEDSIAVVVQHTEQISITTAKIDKKIDVLTQLQKDNPCLESIGFELAGLRDQISALAQRSVSQPAMQSFIENSQTCVQNAVKPIAAEIAAAQGSCTNTGEIEFARELVEGRKIEPFFTQVGSGLIQKKTPCPTSGKAFPSREDHAANEHFGNNVMEARGHSDAQLRASQGEVAKLQGEIRSAQQLQDGSFKQDRQQRSTFTSMQKEYQRESSTYQTFLSDTLRNGESLVLELAHVPETDGKLYCIAQANTSRQKVEYPASLSEALLPETMSEQEGQRCAIPLAVFLCRRTGQHSSLIDASLLVFHRSEKRFGLPTTYGEAYSALKRFYKDTLNVEKNGFLLGSTVADLVAHLADLYTPGLSQPLDGTMFFLQIGSRRLAGDEKIKDIEEMREDALWLMCKSADLSDEDVMIQDLTEKPMLRVILSLQEMQTLAGLQQPFKVLDAHEEQSLQQRPDGFVLPEKVTKQRLTAAEANSRLPVSASSVSTAVQARTRGDALREAVVATVVKNVRDTTKASGRRWRNGFAFKIIRIQEDASSTGHGEQETLVGQR